MGIPLSLKRLAYGLADMQEIPLWGSIPPFPWDHFSRELATTLGLSKLKIAPLQVEWIPREKSFSGLGDAPSLQFITLSPLPGFFVLAIAKQGQQELVHLLLTDDPSPKKFSDPHLNEGFYQFIFLNVLEAFNRLSPYPMLMASLSEEFPLEEESLCIDFSIEFQEHRPLIGRLICPRQSYTHLKTHFLLDTPPPLSSSSLGGLSLPIFLEVGKTTLSFSQWEKVKIGDLVLLDRCSFDPKTKRGTARLTIGDTPLFEVRVKENEIKILEYALHQEEHPMTRESSSDDSFPDSSEEKEEETGESGPFQPQEGESGVASLISSRDIPISLSVELARLQISLEKVMQLQPGNLLPLPHAPEGVVFLTSGGKPLAMGELVRMGDALGVKILQLES